MSSPYLARGGVKIDAPIPPGCDENLTPEAVPQAAQLFELMMVSPECKDVLTLEAYRYL